MPSTLHVEMLGRLRARSARASVTRFRTRKTSALFGYLAFHCERSHPREVLAELLWPEASDHAGRNSLSQALTSLRHELQAAGRGGSPLAANWSTVHLHCTTDVAEFEAAIRGAGGRRRLFSLKRAVELYRGELLPGLGDEWIVTERGRLRDLFLKAVHDLVLLLREIGDLPAAIAAAQRAVREDPLSEVAIADLAETRQWARRGSGPPSRGAIAGTSTHVLVQLVCELSRSQRWAAALASARARIKEKLAALGGRIFVEEPLRIAADFAHPLTGVDCAVRLLADLRQLAWPNGEEMDTRIALDTSLKPRPSLSVDEWLGCSLRKGEIVLSEATAALVRRKLKSGLLISEVDGCADRPGAQHFYRIEFDGGLPIVAAVP